MRNNLCPRGEWAATESHLLLWDDKPYALARAPTPGWVRAVYARILAATGLHCRPQLIWVKNAGGAGGLYLGDAIVVGAADVRRIAITVVERYLGLKPLTPYEVLYSQEPTYPLAMFKREVLRVLLAHELGHALLHQYQQRSGDVHEELRADVWVGRIAQALNWEPGLQRLILHAIGCRLGPACTHPSPQARVAAYDRGRMQQRQRTSRRVVLPEFLPHLL